MKKITLAISTLLLAASSAMAINAGSTYVVVPADAATKEAGMFLSVNGSGSLAYTNDLTDAAKWDYVIGEPEGFNYPFYLTNGGKYLNIAEEGAAMSDEPAKVFISFSNEVEGANTISNGNFQLVSPDSEALVLSQRSEPRYRTRSHRGVGLFLCRSR